MKMNTKKYIKVFTVAFALMALAACTKTVTTHGQVIDSAQLQAIEVGVATKRDVQRSLGSPSVTGTFHDDRWYYITETKVDRPLNPNILTERGVFIVEFDAAGLVNSVRKLDKNDGHEVVPVGRVTPTQGQSLGVIEQLMQNLGAGF